MSSSGSRGPKVHFPRGAQSCPNLQRAHAAASDSAGGMPMQSGQSGPRQRPTGRPGAPWHAAAPAVDDGKQILLPVHAIALQVLQPQRGIPPADGMARPRIAAALGARLRRQWHGRLAAVAACAVARPAHHGAAGRSGALALLASPHDVAAAGVAAAAAPLKHAGSIVGLGCWGGKQDGCRGQAAGPRRRRRRPVVAVVCSRCISLFVHTSTAAACRHKQRTPAGSWRGGAVAALWQASACSGHWEAAELEDGVLRVL